MYFVHSSITNIVILVNFNEALTPVKSSEYTLLYREYSSSYKLDRNGHLHNAYKVCVSIKIIPQVTFDLYGLWANISKGFNISLVLILHFFLYIHYLVPALGIRTKGDRTRRILGIHNSLPGPVTNSLWAFGAKYDLILVLQDRTCICKISPGLVGAIFGCWIGARFWRQVKNGASLFRGNIKMYVIYGRANSGITSISK
jgi:hypothetical protein